MVGEIGALGGSILPNLLGQSKQHTGSFAAGFAIYAAFAIIVLVMLRVVSRKWTQTWLGAGGRVLGAIPVETAPVLTGDGILTTP